MFRWALKIMSASLAVYTKIQEELDHVVGRGMDVTWDKRDQLHYNMATVREIQRFADIAQTGLLHKTVVDVEFRDYSLPPVSSCS